MLRQAGVAALLLAVSVLAACGEAIGARRATPAATPTATPSMVYVAMGASDAVGVGASDPNTTAYVPRLIARLPAHAFALNLGVSGYTVKQALAEELPQALAAHPTLVTVWLVGNDFRQCTPLADYQRDLDSLLGQLQSQTRAQVFVANAPDMSLLPAIRDGSPNLGACLRGLQPALIRAVVAQWNTAIDAVVAKHHQVLVDLFHSDLAAHPEYIASDGFHPSDSGYRVLADLFWTQITAHHAVPGT
ncbi:MAG TPA: GDSL-type esterase/lipase family protein [Ktedonobacterales bacterium]|jgi:lysophospholipase L1-like esterase